MNTYILWAAICLGIAQIPFIINLFWSIKHGKPITLRQSLGGHDAGVADAHAAAARQLCSRRLEVHRGPYEYSVPGHATDFTPQNEPEAPKPGTRVPMPELA